MVNTVLGYGALVQILTTITLMWVNWKELISKTSFLLLLFKLHQRWRIEILQTNHVMSENIQWNLLGTTLWMCVCVGVTINVSLSKITLGQHTRSWIRLCMSTRVSLLIYGQSTNVLLLDNADVASFVEWSTCSIICVMIQIFWKVKEAVQLSMLKSTTKGKSLN